MALPITDTTYPRVALTHYGSISTTIAEGDVLEWFPFVNNNENSSTSNASARVASYKAQRPDGVYVSYMIPTEMPEYAAVAERSYVRQKICAEFALGRDWLLRQKGTRLLIGSFGVRTQINPCGAPDAAGNNPLCALFKAKFDGWYSAISTDGIWFDGGAPYPGVTSFAAPFPASTSGYGLGAASGSTTVLKLQTALPTTAGMVGRKVHGLHGKNCGISRVISSVGDTSTVTLGSAAPSTWVGENYIISGYESQGSTTFTATTATDPSAAWTTNEWVGGFIECDGQLREIVSNTATVVTLASLNSLDNWDGTPTGGTAFELFAAPSTTGFAALTVIAGVASSTSDGFMYLNADPFLSEGADSPACNSTSPRWATTYLDRCKEMLQYAKSYPVSQGKDAARWIVGGNGTIGVVRGHERLWDHFTYEGMLGYGGSDYSLKDRELTLREAAEHARTQDKVEDGYVPCGLVFNTGTPSFTIPGGAGWDAERAAFVAMQLIGWYCMQFNTGYSSAPKVVLNEIKLLRSGFGGTSGWGEPVDGIQSRKAAGKDYWRREFEHVLCVWNPSRSDSVTVVEPGWKRFDADDIFGGDSQSPSINTGGSAGGSGFTLAADQGIVLIRE